jgi:hypothetical protein
MDAIPPKQGAENEPQLAAQAQRARTILLLVMAGMIGLPLLLFVLFHT